MSPSKGYDSSQINSIARQWFNSYLLDNQTDARSILKKLALAVKCTALAKYIGNDRANVLIRKWARKGKRRYSPPFNAHDIFEILLILKFSDEEAFQSFAKVCTLKTWQRFLNVRTPTRFLAAPLMSEVELDD